MRVIGTAGHVDHGKSTLVHALTGIDPDRLPEEKRRGMTIDLGFAWCQLPRSGMVSIVDVPGHERFIHHMLAGVGGIDTALLVIAADEGPMPQTREHLAILDLLQVPAGVIAVTKTDLVDAEWLALVMDEIEQVIKETCLAGSALVPVSAQTGEGLERLRAALDASVQSTPPPIDRARAYLPIDRVFSVAGFGTVVTGTLHDGTLAVGQDVDIVPRQRHTRIRGLQVHRERVESASPGQRVAVNLVGIDVGDISRGDMLAKPGMVVPAQYLDVHLRALPSNPQPLAHNLRLSVHLGAAEVPGRLALLNTDDLAAGATAWAQLRLSRPIAAVVGQRVVVRIASPSATVAGGVVARTQTRRQRRFNTAIVQELERLISTDSADRVYQVLTEQKYATPDHIAQLTHLPLADVEEVLIALERSGRCVALPGAWCDMYYWRGISRAIEQMLADFHHAFPLRSGQLSEHVRIAFSISPRLWPDYLARLRAEGTIGTAHDRLFLASHTPRWTPQQRSEADRILGTLRAAPFAPPSYADMNPDAVVLDALCEQGTVVRLSDTLLIAADAYHEMVERILTTIDSVGSITVAQTRDMFESSRRLVLALLDYLDSLHITRRVGDARVRGTGAR